MLSPAISTPTSAGSPLVANGLPNFSVVGLTDRAIQGARERVRASIRNADFGFLSRRLTVNLVPAESPGLLSRLLLKHDRSLMRRFDRLPAAPYTNGRSGIRGTKITINI
jgi:hypothetical protein